MELSKETIVIDETMQKDISEKMKSFMGQKGLTSIAQGACLGFVSKITDSGLFGYFESSEEALADFAAMAVFGRILLNVYGISDDTIDSEIGKAWYRTKKSVEESLKKLEEENKDVSTTEESPDSVTSSDDVESAGKSEETVS